MLSLQSLNLLVSLLSSFLNPVEMRETSACIALELDVLDLFEHLSLLSTLLVDVFHQLLPSLCLQVYQCLHVTCLSEL